MRNTIIIVVFGLLVALSGCGTPAPETTPTPTEAPSQNAELLAKVGRGDIHDLVFTPDGKFILAAFESGLGTLKADSLEIVTFWDLSVTPLRVVWLGMKEAAVLSSSGEIVSVGFDPASGAFSASSRAAISSGMSPRFDDNERLSLAASPDGKYLAFSGQESTRAWNLETGQATWNESRKLSIPQQLSFSSDSRYLLLGDSSGQSYSAENTLVSLADGQAVWSEKGNSLLMRGESLVFWPSPDEYRIAPLTDPAKGYTTRVSDRFHDGRRFFSPDGMLMAHIDWNGQFSLFGLSEPGVMASASLYNDTAPITGLRENPFYLSNTGKLFTYKSLANDAMPGNKSFQITYTPLLLDFKQSNPVIELTPPFELTYPLPPVYFAPNGESIVYADGSRLVRVDFATQKTNTHIDQLTSGITALAFAPDGKTLAAGGQSSNVTYFDASQGLQEVHLEALPIQTADGGVIYDHPGQSSWFSGVTGLAFYPNGKQLLASTSSGFLYLLALDGKQPPFAMGIHENVSQKGGVVEIFGLSISPDHQVIATGGAENAVRLWNGLAGLIASQRENGAVLNISHRSGAVIHQLLDDASPVTSVTYAPTGNLIAAGTEKGLIRLWLPDGTLQRTLSGHAGRITGLAWAGETLISASEDGSVRFWQINDGTQTRLLTISESVTSLALDPRSELLALGTQGGKTYLWEMGTGRWLGMIPGPGVIRALAFSADASRLAIGSESGQIQLWKVRLAGGELAKFPAGEPQDFIPACALSGDVRGFKDGTFLAGSLARLSWEIPYSGDCSGLSAANLREVANSPSLNAAYRLTSAYGYPRLPRPMNTLKVEADLAIPAESGTYHYGWELTAPDGQTYPISASITIIESSAGVNLPAPLYFVSENQALLRLEADGHTITPIVEAPVICMDISPSSGELAYLSDDALWLADLNGGNRRLLLPISGCPSWSTDGTLIGFTLNGVKVVNVATGEVRTLARDLRAFGIQVHIYRRVLDWSPFSNKFIVSVSGWEFFGLRVFDLPTGTESGLTGSFIPSWSLNGEYIYTANPEYSGYDGTPPYLLRTSVLTGQDETLLGNSETNLTGSFAPFETADGHLLAFVGQATSTDAPPASLAAAQVSLEAPGHFTYDPNPHPILSPAEAVWWRDGSAAIVKLTGGEVLVTFPFSDNPNAYLPVRGTDLRWNRFAPAIASAAAPTVDPTPSTASNGLEPKRYTLAFFGGAAGNDPQLTTIHADGSGQMRPYPAFDLQTPLVEFAWSGNGESLFALTESGELYQARPMDDRFYELALPTNLPLYTVPSGGGTIKGFSSSPDGRYLAVVYVPTDASIFDLPHADQRRMSDNLGLLDMQEQRWIDVDIPAISSSYTGKAAILFSASAWSPNSQQFVVTVTQDHGEIPQSNFGGFSFTSLRAGSGGSETEGLVVADVRGNARNITLSTGAEDDVRGEFHAFWAADNQIYFYSTDEAYNPGLYRINPSGKAQARLADCEEMDITSAAFVVAPDGKFIAAPTPYPENGSFHWAVISTSNGEKTFLPLESEPVEMPVWSPDGKRLAWFVLDEALNSKILVLNALDHSLTPLNLPEDLTEAHSLTWSPNGQVLAFRSYLPGGGPRLYVLPTDSRAASAIASDVLDGPLAWSPVIASQP